MAANITVDALASSSSYTLAKYVNSMCVQPVVTVELILK
jgi:hypothetical protein